MQENEKFSSNAVIKVIGVGGAGGNAINTMIEQGLSGVEFIAANTDVQALHSNLAPVKIQLGRELTKGLGAGANPEVGRDAALEDKAIIQEVLSGADMVFVTAGTGGGTGTGAAPIIAQVAREIGALTVGVVTKPFSFEGKRRKVHSEQGIQSLKASVDTLITIPNQRLLSIAPPQMSMLDGFKLADEVLLNAVKGISDIINIPGRVNVDFADVRTIMSEMGMALMGIGTATGENRAIEAARAAINSPLLEDVDIEGATGILINITGSSDMTLHEISEASTLIQEAVHEDANIIFGSVVDEAMGENLRVTVIATGFDHARVSLPDAHNKIYPSTTNGYGYQQQGQMLAQQTHGYPTNHQPSPIGSAQAGFGYGHGPTDNRSVHPSHQQRAPRHEQHAPAQHHMNSAPVAPGLSLRSPYEVGQPVHNVRRTEPNLQDGQAHTHLRGMQAQNPSSQLNQQNYNAQPQTSFGNNQTNQGQGRSQQYHVADSEPSLHRAEAGQTSPVQAEGPATVKNEFEELTQWTLELSRQTSPAAADTPEGLEDDQDMSALPADQLLGDDSENEKALKLARELADITPDEGDFETPAFLRRKEGDQTRTM